MTKNGELRTWMKPTSSKQNSPSSAILRHRIQTPGERVVWQLWTNLDWGRGGLKISDFGGRPLWMTPGLLLLNRRSVYPGEFCVTVGHRKKAIPYSTLDHVWFLNLIILKTRV